MRYQPTPSGLLLPTALAAPPAGRRPPMDELAPQTDGRDVTRGIVDHLPLLPPLDPLFRRGGTGFDLDIYIDVLEDFQVMSTLGRRRSAVIGTEWEVQPGGTRRADRMAVDLIRELIGANDDPATASLPALPWDQITTKMHYGLFFGRAHAEVLWMREGRYIVPEAIKVRDPRRFAYRPDGSLVLLTTADRTAGELMPPRKFWSFQTGAFHDDDPYGMGLAHWCYWPVQFKRGIAKLWLTALDKHAMPTTVGHFPRGASASDQARLLSALASLRSQAALILPEGMTAGLLASAHSGASDYEASAVYWDKAISKLITGHDAGADSTPGRLGGDADAADARQDIVKADADLLCYSANETWVRWTVELSLPGAAPPRLWRRTEEEEDLKARAEVDKLVFDMGFKPTLAHVQDTYGGEWEAETPAPGADTGDSPLPATAPAEPDQTPAPGPDAGDQSTPDPAAVLAARTATLAHVLISLAEPTDPALSALDSITPAATPADAQALLDPLIRPLLERIGNDPDRLLEALIETFPAMDTDALERALADLLYYAELAGIVAAEAAPATDPDPDPTA